MSKLALSVAGFVIDYLFHIRSQKQKETMHNKVHCSLLSGFLLRSSTSASHADVQ